MLEACDFKCEICSKQLDVPYVDHCHTTKKVRGILCNKCNFGIGHFDDNPALLESAIRYLKDKN